MVEQVLPVCSSAAFTDDTPASLGGAETGGRSLGGGGGGRRHKRQERVRGERKEERVGRNTLGVRLQKRTVSQHVEEKGIQPCKDQQVSRLTFLFVSGTVSSLLLPHAVFVS